MAKRKPIFEEEDKQRRGAKAAAIEEAKAAARKKVEEVERKEREAWKAAQEREEENKAGSPRRRPGRGSDHVLPKKSAGSEGSHVSPKSREEERTGKKEPHVLPMESMGHRGPDPSIGGPASSSSSVGLVSVFDVMLRTQKEAEERGRSTRDGRVYGLGSEGAKPKEKVSQVSPKPKAERKTLEQGLKDMRLFSQDHLSKLKMAKPPDDIVEIDLPLAPGMKKELEPDDEILWHGSSLLLLEEIMEEYWRNRGRGLKELTSRSESRTYKNKDGSKTRGGEGRDVFGSDMLVTAGGYPMESWVKVAKGYAMKGDKVYKDQPYPMLVIIAFSATKANGTWRYTGKANNRQWAFSQEDCVMRRLLVRPVPEEGDQGIKLPWHLRNRKKDEDDEDEDKDDKHPDGWEPAPGEAGKQGWMVSSRKPRPSNDPSWTKEKAKEAYRTSTSRTISSTKRIVPERFGNMVLDLRKARGSVAGGGSKKEASSREAAREKQMEEDAAILRRAQDLNEEEAQSLHEGVLERCRTEQGPQAVRTDWAEVPTSSEDEDGFKKPKLGAGILGNGPPLKVKVFGKQKEFHDGSGLCSPGRWAPDRRNLPEATANGSDLAKLLSDRLHMLVSKMEYKKKISVLAAGKGEVGPFDWDEIQEGREMIAAAIVEVGGPTTPTDPENNQCFLHGMIGNLLRLFEDPDWRIYSGNKRSFSTGVWIGANEKLPRTPALYERKTKWKHYSEDLESGIPQSKSNYGSAKAHKEFILGHFSLEEDMYFMRRERLEVAQAEYGDRLRIAALAALEKSEDSFRIIHDGTHDVLVNPSVKVRDQTRSPGIGEVETIHQRNRQRGGSHFALKEDVGAAHRRCLIERKDHGLQACQVEEEEVWMNEVGTFGIGSAAYWWGRLISGPNRIVLYILGRAWFWQLIFADDYSWVASGANAIINLLMAVFLRVLLGCPFSWKKFRGGYHYVDYTRFQVGLYESRSRWLAGYIRRILKEGATSIKNFREGLGRTGFAAGAIDHPRPFLGRPYAWTAVMPPGTFAKPPVLVKIILRYIEEEIRGGGNMRTAEPPEETEVEAFRADAKAEGQTVGIGGWEVLEDTPPEHARWFSITLTKKNAGWAFDGGEPFRKIASLELMGTLLCVLAFPPPESKRREGTPLITFTATTDNLGNKAALSKLMTTKFPLCAATMELCSTLSKQGRPLRLNWAPREQNVEADELSNDKCHRFDPKLRVDVEPLLKEMKLFNKIVKYGRELYNDIAVAKTVRKVERARGSQEERSHKESRRSDRGKASRRSPEKSRPMKERERW